MKIVVLADTHMPKMGEKLPEKVIPDLKDADAIIHAGDWQSPGLYHELVQYGDLYGVYGNVDEDIQELVSDKLLLTLQGFRIGVVHGHGEKKTTEKRAFEAFEGEEVDLIIFGHSHLPLTRWYKKALLFNPGSLMDKRKLPYYSYGVIKLGKEIKCEHKYFKDKS